MSALAQPAKWEKYLWPVVASALFLALWRYSVIWSASKVFPSPGDVQKGILELVRKGVLLSYVADSIRRVGLGFSAAVVLGIPAGLALGWYPAVAQVVNPTIQILRPISPLAWIPLAIAWFGVGDGAAVFLIFMGAFFPIVVTAANAVRSVPPVLRRAGRNFGLRPLQMLAKIVFPAALPQILMGLRIALGIAWLVVVAAEMVAVDSGLGYLVIDARNSGKRYDLVIAAMLIIGLIGLALDLGMRRLGRLKFIRWGVRSDY